MNNKKKLPNPLQLLVQSTQRVLITPNKKTRQKRADNKYKNYLKESW